MSREPDSGGSVRELIQKSRDAARLNQSQLAQRTGVSRSSIIAAEAGTSLPTLDICLKLARGLGVPLDEIVRAHVQDSVRAADPGALAEIEGRLGGGRSHWEEIAAHHGLRIEYASFRGVVNKEGDLKVTRRFLNCVATRPRRKLVFRDRVVGERAPLFAVKGSPKGPAYSMHVSIEGEWAQHKVEFHRPWTAADGPIDIEFETALPKAYVLDLEEYNRRRVAEGMTPERDWRGEYCVFVTYPFETAELAVVFPKTYAVAEWCDPFATWSPAPPDDADYDELHRRTCQESSFQPSRHEATLVLKRPAPGYMMGIRWRPGGWAGAPAKGDEK